MNRQALILGKVWPEPGSSAAGRHMLEIIDSLQRAGWLITFASAARASAHATDIGSIGVQTAFIAVNDDAFDRWLAELNPQLVIFDRFMTEEQFGWRVGRCAPQALKVLDSEDLHCLREWRDQKQSVHDFGSGQIDADGLVQSDLAMREIASIYRCDLTLVISQAEMQLLTTVFQIPADLLHYLPFLSAGRRQGATTDYAQRDNLVFVGTCMHKPNLQAIRCLKKTLWPLIRAELPGVSLKIIGSYPSAEVLQMHKPGEGFEVSGRVEDLSGVLTGARLMLAPLLSGAGLKGKLLEAMEYGLPSLTTAIGAEGLADADHWPGAVADSVEQMVEQTVSLYQDEKQWLSARQTGFALLANFSRQWQTDFQLRLEQLLEQLQQHRRQNFIGRMLQHHFHASHEYMSRWIVAKNKNGA